jgi:hypothetical protein
MIIIGIVNFGKMRTLGNQSQNELEISKGTSTLNTERHLQD